MTQKGDLNKVIGFAQINDLLYYVERGTEVNYITKEAYIDLKTIDKNGTINNLGHLFNLVERHPDDTTIGYVELLRVGDKLLLVTHARTIYKISTKDKSVLNSFSPSIPIFKPKLSAILFFTSFRAKALFFLCPFWISLCVS